VYHQSLDVWKPGSHAGTFRGNQLAMVAGSTTLRIVREQRLDLHAAAMGERLSGHLRGLQKDYPQMGDVRGMGLMLGVEMVEPAGRLDALGRPPHNGALASAVQRHCLKRGLIVEVGGRHSSVIRFLPPLIITAAQIDQVADIFAASVSAAVRTA
jgi:diaminobutyrate-2-oxoglutarate transaminase